MSDLKDQVNAIILEAIERDWHDKHRKNAESLIAELSSRDDLNVTAMAWSTGIVIAVKQRKTQIRRKTS